MCGAMALIRNLQICMAAISFKGMGISLLMV